MLQVKADIISQLRKNLLQWEGYKPPVAGVRSLMGLGQVESAFPNGVFPTAAVHEFVCGSIEQAAAGGGLVTGILSVLMQQGGVCVWIGRAQHLFAPALTTFGVEPHRVIFISLTKDTDTLWVMEEALKCPGLTAVVCELRDMDFKQSRRLQLAVEQSRVTGFVLRNAADRLGSTACAARWQIKSLPSADLNGLPGLGHLRWEVELLKVRNGQTGSWILEWQDGCFRPVNELIILEERQVG
ncbi:Error-prone repair protein ImuA [Mucilaginibacter sabulilitoris]|uniref:Error-prone repair protein ImuA n=1 Tax=Mucilaginibacter sabulilitoris TaxID=1173583 RepID=A0ABZ0TGE9_9SPHI|nr:Error-prone repair protein ImuA [Mucilaginibacter sabulilitoris]WPU91492.1 Error-prone repair protein ImuA [Mucilaginibacter sabulilitoris]